MPKEKEKENDKDLVSRVLNRIGKKAETGSKRESEKKSEKKPDLVSRERNRVGQKANVDRLEDSAVSTDATYGAPTSGNNQHPYYHDMDMPIEDNPMDGYRNRYMNDKEPMRGYESDDFSTFMVKYLNERNLEDEDKPAIARWEDYENSMSPREGKRDMYYNRRRR